MSVDIDRSLTLTEDQYFPHKQTKSGICLHHTVGGTVESTVHYWNDSEAHVGTAYIISREGTIFEVFDPEAWAYQFGLKGWGDDRIPFEKRFIGIEIASEGGLKEANGNLYCFDRVSSRTRFAWDRAFDNGEAYRGYRYFARYTQAQIGAVTDLVNHLCDTFDIPRRIPKSPKEYHGQALHDFEGVIGHVNVRRDKSDPIPDDKFWNAVTDGANLTPVGADGSDGGAEDAADVNLGKLWESNVEQIQNMQRMAGSLVKQILLELEKPGRNTYIRLHDADGHTVHYDFVKGDRSLIKNLANALGAFTEVTDDKLVVRS